MHIGYVLRVQTANFDNDKCVNTFTTYKVDYNFHRH